MRFSLISLTITLMVALAGSGVLAFAQDEAPGCVVPANYAEAINENSLILIKVLGMLSIEPSPLAKTDTAGIYYAMLSSTRHYHEEARTRLPACAQAVNAQAIDTISASQDVIATLLLQQARPQHRRSADRLAQARAHLDQKFEQFFQTATESQLVAETE